MGRHPLEIIGKPSLDGRGLRGPEIPFALEYVGGLSDFYQVDGVYDADAAAGDTAFDRLGASLCDGLWILSRPAEQKSAPMILDPWLFR